MIIWLRKMIRRERMGREKRKRIRDWKSERSRRVGKIRLALMRAVGIHEI